MNAKVMHEASVEIMNEFINLKGSINDSSITLKEYNKLKPVLIKVDNLISDIVSLSKLISEGEQNATINNNG
jgi:hypothetical protein